MVSLYPAFLLPFPFFHQHHQPSFPPQIFASTSCPASRGSLLQKTSKLSPIVLNTPDLEDGLIEMAPNG